MTLSDERISAINEALKTVAPATTITPTQAQIVAGRITARATIMALVKQLVPSWELPYVNITNAEMDVVADAVTKTVVNTPAVAPTPTPTATPAGA